MKESGAGGQVLVCRQARGTVSSGVVTEIVNMGIAERASPDSRVSLKENPKKQKKKTQIEGGGEENKKKRKRKNERDRESGGHDSGIPIVGLLSGGPRHVLTVPSRLTADEYCPQAPSVFSDIEVVDGLIVHKLAQTELHSLVVRKAGRCPRERTPLRGPLLTGQIRTMWR